MKWCLILNLLVFSASVLAKPGEYIAKLRSPQKISALRVFTSKPIEVLNEDGLVFIKSENTSFVSTLKHDPNIEYIEPNFVYSALFKEADPEYDRSWHLENKGQLSPLGDEGIVGADIHIKALWDQGITYQNPVLVALLDTGIEWEHPDLKPNIDTAHGWNFIINTPDSNDDNGHGTHCAGIIGALADNGIGSKGIFPRVKLLPLKFLDKDGKGDLKSAILALEYARKMGARIISNSWGGDPYSQALSDEISVLQKAGILFVAAAGNDSTDNDIAPLYPASYSQSNVISVAASDNQDHLARFSNFGKKTVHLAAPGVAIYSTYTDDDYRVISGTSMAAPQITGIAALFLSYHPEWSPEEIRSRLINGADPIYDLKRKIVSHGRVNAFNAFWGLRSPLQDPDESLWIKESIQIETAHPYEDGKELVYEISRPGADFLRLHFSRIDTENFDHVFIENDKGEVIEDLHGTYQDYFSEPVHGSKIILRFKPDLSLNSWGFLVDEVHQIKLNHF